MSVALGLGRTTPREDNFRGIRPGHKFSVPLFVRHKRDYDIVRDEFFDGPWLFLTSILAEPMGPPERRHGISLSLTWGWTPIRP